MSLPSQEAPFELSPFINLRVKLKIMFKRRFSFPLQFIFFLTFSLSNWFGTKMQCLRKCLEVVFTFSLLSFLWKSEQLNIVVQYFWDVSQTQRCRETKCDACSWGLMRTVLAQPTGQEIATLQWLLWYIPTAEHLLESHAAKKEGISGKSWKECKLPRDTCELKNTFKSWSTFRSMITG